SRLLFFFSIFIFSFDFLSVFFFNYTSPTQIYTLSLHDALPISKILKIPKPMLISLVTMFCLEGVYSLSFNTFDLYLLLIFGVIGDRKSTRLNSSHVSISYAVFCLKKKKHNRYEYRYNKQNRNVL